MIMTDNKKGDVVDDNEQSTSSTSSSSVIRQRLDETIVFHNDAANNNNNNNNNTRVIASGHDGNDNNENGTIEEGDEEEQDEEDDDEEKVPLPNRKDMLLAIHDTIDSSPEDKKEQHYFYRLAADRHHCHGKNLDSSKLSIKGISDNEFMTKYFHWLFRSSFGFLFGLFAIGYFLFILFFTGFIALAGTVDAQCVRISGAEYNSVGAAFADAFDLSWTTFSTVGYGTANPALSTQNDNRMNCFWISLLCSIESLAGILYGAFYGAVMFGKILRSQSHAQVKFTDAIVIRYGNGVMDDYEYKLSTSQPDHECNINQPPSSPFPVLEFRLVNLLSEVEGGEIIGASLKVVANVDAHDDLDNSVHGNELTLMTMVDDDDHHQQEDTGIASFLSRRNILSLLGSDHFDNNDSNNDSSHHKKHLQVIPPTTTSTNTLMSSMKSSRRLVARNSSNELSENQTGSHHHHKQPSLNKAVLDVFGLTKQKKRHKSKSDIRISGHGSILGSVDEDANENDSLYDMMNVTGKQIFVNMHIEACHHPYFKRVWLARHVLDLQSPLLKPKIKRLIERRNNSWPEEYNNPISIRDAIEFNQILVSFGGVANYSAHEVHYQRVYHYQDISVGYQFVHMLYRNKQNGSLQVNVDLLNDVQEQNGGGGEPLDYFVDEEL